MSQTTISTENVSILARAGLFSHDVATSTICPRHRVEMGVMWRPKRICANPRRETRQNEPKKVEDLDMSKHILATWNVLVPVGAGNN